MCFYNEVQVRLEGQVSADSPAWLKLRAAPVSHRVTSKVPRMRCISWWPLIPTACLASRCLQSILMVVLPGMHLPVAAVDQGIDDFDATSSNDKDQGRSRFS